MSSGDMDKNVRCRFNKPQINGEAKMACASHADKLIKFVRAVLPAAADAVAHERLPVPKPDLGG